MFMSLHSKDIKEPKILVDLINDEDFQGVDDFEKHPVCMTIGNSVIYLRVEEAHELAIKLNVKLQDLDRRRISQWNKGV